MATQQSIVVVEDENIAAEDIRRRLVSWGYRVPAVVATGEDAIKSAEQVQPDLVLMDIHLRGRMDGLEAAECIRTRLNVPVIYATAYNDSDTMMRVGVTGPVEIINKPYDDLEMRTAIELVLTRQKRERLLLDLESGLAQGSDVPDGVLFVAPPCVHSPLEKRPFRLASLHNRRCYCHEADADCAAARACHVHLRMRQECRTKETRGRRERTGRGRRKIAENAEKMADAMKDANDGKKVEPVDFRELKALLPESLPGLNRGNVEGERSGAMGIDVSMASADYANENGTSLNVKISDMGSLTGAMRMATLGWTMAQIDRENNDGYEKTTTFNGYKAWEQYWTSTKHGELHVLVAGRFVVEVSGSDCEMSQVKDAAGKVDFNKLAGMKNVGIAS